jgi:hypothetical protein
MNTNSLENGLCRCQQDEICAHCQFYQEVNTPQGRKALCERINQFLAMQPFYQSILEHWLNVFFPKKAIYDDEKDLCTMLFEALLFDVEQAGQTPLSYFISNAPLSITEKQLYEAWKHKNCFGFFRIEKIIPGTELHLIDLTGKRRYRVYETKATASMKERSIILARLVPFLQGWMITTEATLSFSGDTAQEKIEKAYGLNIPQLAFIQKYHADNKRKMASFTSP